MTETAKIVKILWKALMNLSIENDADNIEDQVSVKIGSDSDNTQSFSLTKSELTEFVNDQISTFDCSDGVYFCSDHVEYTVIARQKNEPFLAPFVWGQDVAKHIKWLSFGNIDKSSAQRRKQYLESLVQKI